MSQEREPLYDDPRRTGFYRPRVARAGLGWARQRDIQDRESQDRASRGARGRYDRDGAEEYAAGLDEFEDTEVADRHSQSRGFHIAGPYVGRGPRAYRRKDERIRKDICDLMTEHGQLDASGIEVDVKNGEVVLSGTVPSRHAKRLAEDIAESIAGVQDVRNELRLQSTPDVLSPGTFDQEQTDSGRR